MSLFLNISKKNIVVVGDVMLDAYLIGEVNRISPDAPVPVVWVKEKTATLGGAGNVALNLAGLACMVSIIGVRGDDIQGQLISDIMRERCISDNLIIVENQPTTTKNRVIVQRQQIIRFDEEDTGKLKEKHESLLKQKIEKAIQTANAFILSDYNKGVLNGDICQFIIGLCKSRNIPVFVDPKRKAWERYRGATCITPNIAEIEEVCGIKIGHSEEALLDAAIQLKAQYDFDWFLATRGSDGMCLIGPDSTPFFIKAMAREVFDVSGAGDTVIATLTAAVALGLPFPIASEISNVAAGIVVGKVGSQPIAMKELDAAWKNKDSGMLSLNKNKVFTMGSAALQIKSWKTMNEKIVMTHGCFDLIHPGHIHNFNHARDMGDKLVVALYSDKSVKNIVGSNRPVLNQMERAEILSSLQCIDMVIVCDEKSPVSLVNDFKPDVFVDKIDDLLKNHEEVYDDFPPCCKLECITSLNGSHQSTVLISNMLKK